MSGKGAGPGAGAGSGLAQAGIIPVVALREADGTNGITVDIPGMGRERGEGGEAIAPMQRFDPLALPPPGSPAAATVTINLPVLRGGIDAAVGAVTPAAAAPTLARSQDAARAKLQQPLPAWIGHVLDGAR